MVHFKDESYKKVSIEDFRANYIYKPLPIGPNTTVVSGSSEPLCLGGWVYLTNSRNNADFVVKETSANDYDCAIRIVDKSSPDCDEWRITSDVRLPNTRSISPLKTSWATTTRSASSDKLQRLDVVADFYFFFHNVLLLKTYSYVCSDIQKGAITSSCDVLKAMKTHRLIFSSSSLINFHRFFSPMVTCLY